MQTYCPSCQNEVETSEDKKCPSCGWNFDATPAQPGSIVQPARRPKIQCDVELGITVDRTGSTKPFEVGVPLTLEIILKQVMTKARSVTCTLQSHGDKDEGQECILHTDKGTPEQTLDDIKAIPFEGGGDPSEHHLDGVENLFKIVPWSQSKDSRGAILAFLTADTKPATSGTSARELGEKIREAGILLYLVCEPTPTLQELVDAAQGLMFQISNNPDPKELEKVGAQLAASIVATISTGGTVPMTVPGN